MHNGSRKFNDLFFAAAAQVSNVPWTSIEPDPSTNKIAVYFEDTPALRAFEAAYMQNQVHVPARAFSKAYNALMGQVHVLRRFEPKPLNPAVAETRHHAEDPQAR